MNQQSIFWTTTKAVILFTGMLGIIYPLFVTVIGQSFFNSKVTGSLIMKNNVIIGSKLIGQKFESDQYFHSRPSAVNNNPLPSGASNLSVTDSKLKTVYINRLTNFISNNMIISKQHIPSEMLFASGSGVDPHISKASAVLQINRIASKRNLSEISREKLWIIIDSVSQKTVPGIFGNDIVNVLELNLKLDELSK